MAFADPNEIFFTPFEPKMKNRFIMEIDGIPAYLVKTMARPSIVFDGYSSEYKKDITFNLLSPNGEKIEQWIIKGAFITTANFQDLDFASDEVLDIELTIQYDYAILEF